MNEIIATVDGNYVDVSVVENEINVEIGLQEIIVELDRIVQVDSGGSSGRIETTWAFGDSFPVFVGVIPSGRRVDEACIYVDSPCNSGVGLTLGSMAAHGQIMPAAGSLPQASGAYAAEPDLAPVADYPVYLHVETGTLTQGAGRVVVYLA